MSRLSDVPPLEAEPYSVYLGNQAEYSWDEIHHLTCSGCEGTFARAWWDRHGHLKKCKLNKRFSRKKNKYCNCVTPLCFADERPLYEARMAQTEGLWNMPIKDLAKLAKEKDEDGVN